MTGRTFRIHHSTVQACRYQKKPSCKWPVFCSVVDGILTFLATVGIGFVCSTRNRDGNLSQRLLNIVVHFAWIRQSRAQIAVRVVFKTAFDHFQDQEGQDALTKFARYNLTRYYFEEFSDCEMVEKMVEGLAGLKCTRPSRLSTERLKIR